MTQSSLLQRLKERKLVQWAVAYLAGAWVIYEVTSTVGGHWKLPDSFFQGLFLILAVGFFIILVLAWYHGEKGRQRVSGPELLMVAALLVVAGAAISFVGKGVGDQGGTAVHSWVAADDQRPSIAVLLCDNFSPKPEDAFRAQGIHEEIMLRLQGISSIRSIGRTSVLQFVEDPRPVNEVASALGVGFLGECSVLKDPEQTQIRVTFQLLDARGTQLWAESYDRDLTVANIYEIQGDIAQRVATSVGARLMPTEKNWIGTAPTENLLAYDLYTQGRILWWTRGVEALEQAIELFQRATVLDPDFALAFSGLAETYAILPELKGVPFSDILPLARAAAEKALSLDPDLAEAHTASGYLHAVFEWDREAAERDYLRAIQLNPDYGTAHQWYAELLGASGRWEEALGEIKRAIELDPRSPASNMIMGFLLLYTGRHAEAIQSFERSNAIVPEFPPPCWGLGDSHMLTGDYEEAATWYMRAAALDGSDPQIAPVFLTALSNPERLSQAVQVLKASETENRAAAYLALLGETDEALAALERAFDEHAPYLPWINSIPYYDGIRSDPRFQALLRRMNFPVE